MASLLTSIYRHRFDAHAERRQIVWRQLCSFFFQQYVRVDDVVVDVACGYGEFLNNIKSKKKIGVDLNPEARQHVSPEVEFIEGYADNLEFIPEASIDIVFMSNFLEHLDQPEAVLRVLRESHRILRPGGHIMIVQPNIYYIGGQYWRFLDHKLPITHWSLVEALELTDFHVVRLLKKFLPYTMDKSRLPLRWLPWLIRLYLAVPLAQWVMGKQTFVLAKK